MDTRGAYWFGVVESRAILESSSAPPGRMILLESNQHVGPVDLGVDVVSLAGRDEQSVMEATAARFVAKEERISFSMSATIRGAASARQK